MREGRSATMAKSALERWDAAGARKVQVLPFVQGEMQVKGANTESSAVTQIQCPEEVHKT